MVVGTKYLGEVEAYDEDEAIQLGYELDTGCVNVCHQCSSECEDPLIDDINVELIEE